MPGSVKLWLNRDLPGLVGSRTTSGRKIAERLGLPFGILDQQLGALRTRQIVAHARSAPINDFYYSLTENGQNRAIAHRKSFTYVGPAPVPLADYIVSVEAQLHNSNPSVATNWSKLCRRSPLNVSGSTSSDQRSMAMAASFCMALQATARPH